MFTWLKNLLVSKYLGSIVRTATAALAGFLLSAGIDPVLVERFTSDTSAILIALVLYGLTQLSSLQDKKEKK